MHSHKTLYISHADCLKHEIPQHAESPMRLAAIESAISASEIQHKLKRAEAPAVALDDILRVHSEAYYQHIIQSSPETGTHALDPDTSMNPHTLRAALLAAGAATFATTQILNGEAKRAFCAVRPPGHHAEKDKAMGFCLFNNIAIAAAQALEHPQIERVAIIDFDVHHGNGTENMFMDDPRVLICSSYQSPLYPNSGCDTIPGHIINLPFDAGTTGDKYIECVLSHWAPTIENFKPQLMFISAGFDAHKDDPLAGMMLDDHDYFRLTEALCRLADTYCEGRLISSLEGGYNVEALSRCVVAHLHALTSTPL